MKKYLYEELFNLEDKHWWHIAKRTIVYQLIEKYAEKKNPRILDIGCGTGKNIEKFKNLGTVYGLDSSTEALKFCKRRGLKNLILGSAEKIPLKEKSFDMITLLDVLEHTDDNKTLKESYRILRKDGFMIITVPAFKWLWSKWDMILHHRRRYTSDSLIAILERNNFQVRKISYMYSFLVLPALIIRMIKSISIKQPYSSDFKLSSSLLNFIMNKITKFESFFVKYFGIPIGTSIIAVAQKKS